MMANDTQVRTVEAEKVSLDWTPEALISRQWGVVGSITKHHDAHGLTYEVRHPDGSIGHYEERELEEVTHERH
jgi:hypothetical protein